MCEECRGSCEFGASSDEIVLRVRRGLGAKGCAVFEIFLCEKWVECCDKGRGVRGFCAQERTGAQNFERFPSKVFEGCVRLSVRDEGL